MLMHDLRGLVDSRMTKRAVDHADDVPPVSDRRTDEPAGSFSAYASVHHHPARHCTVSFDPLSQIKEALLLMLILRKLTAVSVRLNTMQQV